MILLLDFEATGIDPSVARTLEIGAALVENDLSYPEPLQQPFLVDTLVWESGYPPLTDEVAKVTGITQENLTKDGLPPVEAFTRLSDIITTDVRFVVAYNKVYDQTLFEAEVVRHNLASLPGIHHLLTIPWLCAMRDIPTNPPIPKKLMYLALDYGVTVDPKKLHRAINDVELMRDLLLASGVTIKGMHAYQQEPSVVIQAKVPYERRDEPKKMGYSWETVRGDKGDVTYTKKWVKRVKQSALEHEQKTATFEVLIID